MEAFARQHRNFVFEGKVANDGLHKYYHQADFLLIPSQYKEGLGRVIIEAMYCGVPVIGSKIGGIAEAVDSEVGILTDGSVEGFSSALREIRSNPTKLRALSAKCTSYSHAKFGLKNARGHLCQLQWRPLLKGSHAIFPLSFRHEADQIICNGPSAQLKKISASNFVRSGVIKGGGRADQPLGSVRNHPNLCLRRRSI